MLVDRIWPRGIGKQDAALDHGCEAIAPSTALRKCFDHDPKRWTAFKKKRRKEPQDDDQRGRPEELAATARLGGLVLLCGAKHSQAGVLGEVIDALCKGAL